MNSLGEWNKVIPGPTFLGRSVHFGCQTVV